MAKKLFPIASQLEENWSKHCATLAISESSISTIGLNVTSADEKSRNGTLTFIRSKNITYAITCWHVIEYYRKLLANGGPESYSLLTMPVRPLVIKDNFIRPSSDFEPHYLDIAIQPISSY